MQINLLMGKRNDCIQLHKNIFILGAANFTCLKCLNGKKA